MAPCDTCKGTGEVETGIGMLPCDVCRGAGVVQPRCLTCKWWGREYPAACGFVETIAADRLQARMVVEATAADDQGLRAWLITGPSFGCVHHNGEGS